MRKTWLFAWTSSFNYGDIMNDGIQIIFRIAAIGILIAVICQVLKKTDRDDIATFVSLAGLIIVLTLVIGMISDLFKEIQQIFNLY